MQEFHNRGGDTIEGRGSGGSALNPHPRPVGPGLDLWFKKDFQGEGGGKNYAEWISSGKTGSLIIIG
jgi:hypothetical protein